MEEEARQDIVSLTRKNKQEYLIKHIIKQEYDPEDFSNYLQVKKENGQQIDNWTEEELENEVFLFKRQSAKKSDKDKQFFTLEDILVTVDKDTCYVKKLQAVKKKKTILSGSKPYVLIDSIQLKDGKLFFGKTLQYTISIPEKGIEVTRTTNDFNWLHKTLTKEFPFTPLPPLLKSNDKSQSVEALKEQQSNYQRFLNECMRHPNLNNATSLEIFLTSKTGKEFDTKAKDFTVFIEKNSLITKCLTKKGCDSTASNVLHIYPSIEGTVTLKISERLNKHIEMTESQYNIYNMLFEKLEKLHTEYDKTQDKLIGLNDKIKDVLVEFQKTAAEFNTKKPFKTKYSIIEERLFANLANYFNNYGNVNRHYLRRE